MGNRRARRRGRRSVRSPRTGRSWTALEPLEPRLLLDGSGLSFDGDDYIDLGSDPDLVLGSTFTLEAWICPNLSDDNWHGVLGCDPGDYLDRSPSLWVYQQTRLHGGFGDGTEWNNLLTDDVLTAGAWNHVAASFDGTTYRLYVNGFERASTTNFAGKVPAATPIRYLGKVDSCFAGSIDEVAVWNVARTAEQIAADMTQVLAGTESGLVGYWRMEEGAGQTAHDSSANGLDGVLGASGNPEYSDPCWALGHEGLNQYATSVHDFSSQYSSGSWSASQTLGPPNTFSYGEHSTSWAPSTSNGGVEHVTLVYDRPVYATGAVIRETYGSGCVTGVEVMDLDGALHQVWSGTDPSTPGTLANFRVTWPQTSFPVQGLRVTLDTDLNTSWEEIDSVQLQGIAVPGAGEIHGAKWSDLDGEGDWDAGEPPVSGWLIYLDTNRDGKHDPWEPSTTTGADGSYSFTALERGTYVVAEEQRAGWEPTYPTAQGTPQGDGYADVVLDFYDSGAGPLPGPYGGTEYDYPIAVSFDVVLGDDAGTIDFLSLPTGSYVVVGFVDETVLDGTGYDIFIRESTPVGERADIYVRSATSGFVYLGTADDSSVSSFDLASIGFTEPVTAVKIVGLDSLGGSPGFDVVNVQVLPGSVGAAEGRHVVALGMDEVAENVDFGNHEVLTGPRVVDMTPQPSSFASAGGLTGITVQFSRPVDPDSINPSTFLLVGSGGDGIFGNEDDVSVTASSVELIGPDTAVFHVPSGWLQPDAYQVRLVGDSQALSAADAELMALGISGELLAPPQMVQQITGDLEAIRRAFPEMTDIRHHTPWPAGVLELTLTDDAFDQWNHGEYHGLDAMNAQYGVASIDPYYGSRLVLTFEQPYSPLYLADVYAAADGVLAAGPCWMIGPMLDTIDTADPFETYTFNHHFGLWAGAQYSHHWTFAVDGQAVTLVDEWGDPLTEPLLPRVVADANGVRLDGEFPAGGTAGDLPSGNGDPGGDFEAVFTVAWEDEAIYYVSDQTGTGSIWRMTVDGSEPRLVLGLADRNIQSVNVNPAGDRLAFVTEDLSADPSSWTLWLADIDGANMQQVPTAGPRPHYSVGWSPDGQYLFYATYEEGIFRIGTDGSGQQAITTDMYDDEPDVSVTGQVAYVNRQDLEIRVVDPDGTNNRLVVSGAGLDSVGPAWSPDGSRILYARGGAGICLVDADGSNDRVLLAESPGESLWSPDWSLDGSQIVYTRSEGTGSDLWIVNADGTGARPLTATAAWEYFPDWAGVLTAMAQPPRVASIQPAPGASVATGVSSIALTFTESMEPATVWTTNFRLVASGGDGAFGDGNDTVWPIRGIAWNAATHTAVLDVGGFLPRDTYQLTAYDGLQDTSGSRLDGEWFGRWPSGDGTGGGDLVVTFVVANTPPVAHDAQAGTLQATPVPIVLAGRDDDGDALTFRVVSGPAHGQLLPGADSAHWTYVPAAGFSGNDSIRFVANDGTVDSAEGTFSLTVAPQPCDLEPISLTVTTAGPYRMGEAIGLTWTGRNNGPGETVSGWWRDWQDRVYLSADEQWDEGDVYLGAWDSGASPVASGATYTGSLTALLPADREWSGTYYLIVKANADAGQRETDADNNTHAEPIVLAPYVELTSPRDGKFVDCIHPLVLAWRDCNQQQSAVVSVAIDADDDPLNGTGHQWVLSGIDEDADGADDRAQVTLPALAPGSYYLWAKLADGTGEYYSAPVLVQVFDEAYEGAEPLGDALGGSSYEVHGVELGYLGDRVYFRVRTNYNPVGSAWPGGGGDIYINVGGSWAQGSGTLVGLAVRDHATSGGQQVSAGQLYLGAGFDGGRCVPRHPTFIAGYGSAVAGQSDVAVTPTPDRAWHYEVTGSFSLSAIGATVDDPLQIEWAMYCGNDEGDGDNGKHKSDLVGDGFLIADIPANVTWGDSFTVAYTEANIGQADAGASTAAFYLSADATIDAGDVPLGTAPVGALAAHTSAIATIVLQLPASPPGGFGDTALLYVGMISDSAGDVSEGDETNNANRGIGLDKAILNRGVADTDGPFVVDHSPTEPADSLAAIQVTFNELIDEASFTAADVLLTGPAGPVAGVTVQHVSGATWLIDLPDQTQRGAYTLRVGPLIKDPAGNHMNQDRDAINGEMYADAFTAEFEVLASETLGDLVSVVGSFDVAPDDVSNGNVQARFNIANVGASSVLGEFEVSFYLSADVGIDPAQDTPVGSCTITVPLDPGQQTGELTCDLSIPAGLTAGKTYYVGMVVDSGHAVAEADEANNSSRSIQDLWTYLEDIQVGKLKWTVIAYIDGDDETFAKGDTDETLNYFEAIADSEQVKMPYLADFYGTGDSRRGVIVHDGDDTSFSSPGIPVWPHSGNEANMGNRVTLAEFGAWAVSDYPAEHYLLLITDHGNGWQGLCSDAYVWEDEGDWANSVLSIADLGSALESIDGAIGDNIDVLVFSACLMANQEVAYQIKDSVDILVSSEEVMFTSYEQWRVFYEALVADPNLGPAQIADQTVRHYIDDCSDDDLRLTYSAYELARAEDVAGKTDALAAALLGPSGEAGKSVFDKYKTAILDVRANTQHYYEPSYIDLYHFAEGIQTCFEGLGGPGSPEQAVVAAAADLMTAVGEAVGTTDPGDVSHGLFVGEHSHGITVYYPFAGQGYAGAYEETLFAGTAAPNWLELITSDLDFEGTGADILMVADLSPLLHDAYLPSLAGRSVDVYSCDLYGPPSPELLARYLSSSQTNRAVIWGADDNLASDVLPGDVWSFQSFLDAGGQLMVSGEWLPHLLHRNAPLFEAEYLRAPLHPDFTGPSGSPQGPAKASQVVGKPGDPIGDGLSLEFYSPIHGWIEDSDMAYYVQVSASGLAQPFLYFDGEDCDGTEVAAVHVNANSHQEPGTQYRVVYMPSGFLRLGGEEDREALMDDILDWLWDSAGPTVEDTDTGNAQRIAVTFSEAVIPATLSASTISLTRSGGDGTFDDGNEIDVPVDGVEYDGPTRTATVRTGANVSDTYRLIITDDVTDTASNQLDGDSNGQPGGSFGLTFHGGNAQPNAEASSAAVGAAASVDISLGADDDQTAPESLVYELLDPPAHGQVSLQGRVATYQPEAGWFGPDSFSFTVTDTGDRNGDDPQTSPPGIVTVHTPMVTDARGRAFYNDTDNDRVTLQIRRGGTGLVYFENGLGLDATRIVLQGTTAASTFTLVARGGGRTTSVRDIEVQGSLKSLTARTTTLTGDLTVDWMLRSLALGDVTGGHAIDIAGQVSPLIVGPRDKVTMTFGRVADTTIDTHALPIGTLTATQWLRADGDSDDVQDSITAPWIGTLRITGRRARRGVTALAGDFQADLDLDGANSRGYALGGATIAGEIACDWTIAGGKVGRIKASSTAETWTLDAAGQFVSAVTTTGNLGGSLSAGYFGTVSARADLTADISADGWHARYLTSIGTLSAAAVRDAVLDLQGGLKTLRVGEWIDADADGLAGSLSAGWLGRLTTRRSTRKGLTGNFAADVTLSGEHLPARKRAFGTASVAGDLLGCIDVTGDLWRLSVGGAVRGSADEPLCIRATGDMNSVSLACSEHADFLAGVLPNGKRHAETGDDFIVDALSAIKSFTVKGVRRSDEFFFVDTTLSAVRLGTIRLRNTDPDSGECGLYYPDVPGSLKKIEHRETQTGHRWTIPARSRDLYAPPPGFINPV